LVRKIVDGIWSWLKSVSISIGIGILYALSTLGVMAYFIKYIASLASGQPSVSPLELAAASGGLCGLILLGAFYQKGSRIEYSLKFTAKLFLAATISFVIAFFLLELVSMIRSETLNAAEWIAVIATDIVIACGGISLIAALVYVISLLRKL